MRDLHQLTREEGHDTVAASMGITPRSLSSKRSGARPLTVDDLYRLRTAYPDFDLGRTVERIGGKRAEE